MIIEHLYGELTRSVYADGRIGGMIFDPIAAGGTILYLVRQAHKVSFDGAFRTESRNAAYISNLSL